MNPEGLYPNLDFPPAPEDRPYVFVNMVATIDGKIITGDRDQSVHDLGSPTDHASMRQIEAAAQAVLIGAGTLRATPNLHYPENLLRLVVSVTGKLDPHCRFFTQNPDSAYVVTTIPGSQNLPPDLQAIAIGDQNIDWPALFQTLRQTMGIQRLLVEGGSELNASLLRLDLVDELFLTLAPKIKLGRDVPTYADGEPLSREEVQKYTLLSCVPHENELFLRYRRTL